MHSVHSDADGKLAALFSEYIESSMAPLKECVAEANAVRYGMSDGSSWKEGLCEASSVEIALTQAEDTIWRKKNKGTLRKLSDRIARLKKSSDKVNKNT